MATRLVLLLAAACFLFSSDVSSQVILNDTYFYGDSPPVYPSPPANGADGWSIAVRKAKAAVAKMTMQEKINMTGGVSSTTGCSGFVSAASSIDFPGLCVSDAGNGLRSTDLVDAYPSGIHVGASWNRNLSFMRAVAMGGEFYRKGVNMALGPVIGPLGRVATGGRNWEGISPDPYLGGELVYQTIMGFNDAGVITSTKHYIANEQETNRNPGRTPVNGTIVQAVSSNIDDKTLHELYLWSFQEAVRANTGCIMCSYNRINNSYGCQNSKTLNGILKTELGFQGFVVSDWGAQHAGPDSYNAGLDVAMPSFYSNYTYLAQLYANGSVTAARLNDQVTRILAAYYYLDQDTMAVYETPGAGMAKSLYVPHTVVNGKDASSKQVLLQGAEEGYVLVKNTNNALPLNSPRIVSIFGYDAWYPHAQNVAQPSQNATFGYINQTQWVGGGSGYNQPSYVSDPLSAFQQAAWEQGTQVLYDVWSMNPNIDQGSDACIVFINAYATEGSDRPNLRDDTSDGIVLNVASKCRNTMVVIHNAGIRLVDQFQSHPNVTAIIYGHLPGQDSGRALVNLMYGTDGADFSGRLPYTVAMNETDYGNVLLPTQPTGDYQYFPQSDFTEGIYVDYRYFDQNGITPRYEFGYGLSYTNWAINSLRINQHNSPPAYAAKAKIIPGGNPNLFKTIATVNAMVYNTGRRSGSQVVQLYVGIPNGPVRQLRGFEKVTLLAGGSAKLSFELRRKDLSVWDTVAQDWLLQSGTYNVYVGTSSRYLPLTGTITF